MTEKLHHFNKQLRALHRRLLENERVAAEKEMQQKLNPFAFLNLLMQDPKFAWLRPLSAFMSDLDAFLDDVEELQKTDIQRIRTELDAIMKEAKFCERYEKYKNEDPEFADLHTQLVQSLDAL